MSFKFQRVDSKSVRDDVVNFFWEQGVWPGETREDYYDIWDWRYSALSEGRPVVYLARLSDSGKIVGHIGVYRRHFRVGNVDLQIAVPGNFLVHRDWQKNIVGVRLAMFVRSLVQNGEFDAILAFGNKIANAMFARLGFVELGAMHTYIDVRDAGPLLRRRNRALSVLAPLVNVAFSIRRRLRSSPRGKRHSRLRVSHLTPDQILQLDRSHWAPTSRLVAWDSNQLVALRYLTEPNAQRYVYGLFDPLTGSFEGYVVTETTTRIKVWDCQTNPATIDQPSAIAAVVAQRPDAESVLVPTLPQSQLARDMVRAGFLDLESGDFSEANTYLLAYWLPSNPHVGVLSNPACWNLWLGSRHY